MMEIAELVIEITEITKEQILLVYILLDKHRIKFVEDEEYEICSELRDMQKIISDYTLGYITDVNKINWPVYYAVLEFGDLIDLHKGELYEATFELHGTYITFILEEEEGKCLQKLMDNYDE